MDRTRAFVAIALPDAVGASIDALRGGLPAPPRALRWVPVAQAHLTLAFLGDLDGDTLTAVRGAVAAAAAAAAPFDASLGGVGAFPHPGRARVVWAGWRTGAHDVVALHRTLADALARAIGYRRDPRPFVPHVTIARAREPLDLQACLAPGNAWRGPPWRVAAVDLMASELLRTGARHTLLARLPLSGGG